MCPYPVFVAQSRAGTGKLFYGVNISSLENIGFLTLLLSFAYNDKVATGQMEMDASGYINKALFIKVGSRPDWLEGYGLLTSY